MLRIVRKYSGFTIVELLIVIVVIGILAAITVVAFGAIQQRANNAQTTAATKDFVKAYAAYAVENGDYPNATGCLGEGYPANRCLSQNGTAACWSTGGATSTAVNTALRPYMGGRLPAMSMQEASCGGTTYVGAYAAYNVTTRVVTILMVLRGDQTCPIMSSQSGNPSKAFLDDATRCSYVLPAVS